MEKPRVCIVSPAAEGANNGNSHTAARWRRFLAPLADVRVARSWRGEPVAVLIALHARRSADSILRFRDATADAPLAVVLTGTDLYRDIDADTAARRALRCASEVVVLQEEGLRRLDAATLAKARVIEQSAATIRCTDSRPGEGCAHFNLTAVGHLRDEKDPLVLMQAARLLPQRSTIRILHMGDALDEALADAARRTAAECPRYHWLGGVPHSVARRRIATSRALVHMSRIEGGANAVIEAICSGVPVLASRIDGNVGLLGRDYQGYFPPGDAPALAALMRRLEADADLVAALAAQCALRAPRFSPRTEQRKVRELLASLLTD
jgi:putative glycosyltransferase (TIGR04348 family)